MKINLYYNDFKKEIDIDISNKIGIIQENILNCCSLMIYNIEYSEIIIDNNSYILGEEPFNFNDTLEVVLKKLDKELIDIHKIIIYDRKRDIYGNVIQNNSIISNYHKWYNEYENENYINYMNENNNHYVIRYPLSIMLNNILNIPSNQVAVDQVASDQVVGEQVAVDQGAGDQVTDDQVTGDQIADEQVAGDQVAGDQIADEQVDLNEDFNRYRPIINSELNNFINIFDNYIRNNEINYEYYEIQQLLDINENIVHYNLFSNYEDVKITLNEEQFNNIETIIYENLNNNNNDECLICTEQFVQKDIIKKIKCNHLFHTHCIKPWLCEESNKCPICRVEADNANSK
jgi:hypothetical protein